MDRILNIFKAHWLLLILSFIVFTILLSLGYWQLKRLYWKEELLSTIEARIDFIPKSIEEILTIYRAGEDVEYMPVILTGTFKHSSERHYYATHNGVAGWFVFTPFQFENARIIFVNRGFVPETLKHADQRLESLIDGKIEIVGLVRIPPKNRPNIFIPDNQPDKNQFYWRSLEEMTSSVTLLRDYQVEPLFIDAKSIPNLNYPKGSTTLVKLPNNHLQYAITWFGLAIVLIGVCGRFLWIKWNEYTCLIE